MTRTQLAGYALIASACVLTGLLLVQLGGLKANEARAEMVLNKDTVTMLTTSVQAGEEALFVMDSVNEALLIYTLDFKGAKGSKLELAHRQELGPLFGVRPAPRPRR